jgi:hypothetical protein
MIKACLVALKEYITIAVILFFCFPLLIIAETIEYLAGRIADSIKSVVNKLDR